MTGASGKNGMMKAGSNHAWWFAAMMYGGAGMFSSPVTVTRNRTWTSHLTMRRMTRYRAAG
jgi:hypothetical protein